MKFPSIHGYIDRRMLVNFIADPNIVAKIIPAPFRPKIYKNKAIVGVCLIRLKNIKPKGLPDFVGIASENAAHRIAVEWDAGGNTKEGVYIPRRDTSLKFNVLAGGRVFPGKHFYAKFNVKEAAGNYHIDFTSSDGTGIAVDAKETKDFNKNSIFENLENASHFFEKGSVGYSPNGNKYEGLELQTYNWHVAPLDVINISSGFFGNENIFPNGSIQFDSALLMTRIEHEWHNIQDIEVKSSTTTG